MNLTLTSTAFSNGSSVPRQYTGDGRNVSPPLAWSNPPEGTTAFVLICDDADAPVGIWVHWVIYDIPAGVSGLEEDVPKNPVVLGSAKQGRNDYRKTGYDGPGPPPGKPHRYFFRLYAVDSETGLQPGATRDQVLKAIKGHVLAETQLMGTYQR